MVLGYIVDAEPYLYDGIHKNMTKVEIWANLEDSKQHLWIIVSIICLIISESQTYSWSTLALPRQFLDF